MPSVRESETIGIANLPNQLHRIVSKKGATFTIMIVGESGMGKTTFINTLFTTDVISPKTRQFDKEQAKTVDIEVTRAFIEEKGFLVDLTVVDTPGFGDYVNNENSHLPLIKFINDQHEAFLNHENQSERSNIQDTRVHVCLYFIPPSGHSYAPILLIIRCGSLRQLDVAVMKALSGCVNLIPVIAKSDTMTPGSLAAFKERIRDSVSRESINVYSSPLESDDEETTKRNIDIMSHMPFSVVGSTQMVPRADGTLVLGREYPWGTVEVENEKHNDFIRLRSLIIRTHMHDLISTTKEIHYENYRVRRLGSGATLFSDPTKLAKSRELFEANMQQEEESFRRRLTQLVAAEENRFKMWEDKLIQERDRLRKNLETDLMDLAHFREEIEALEQQQQRR